MREKNEEANYKKPKRSCKASSKALCLKNQKDIINFN
jgi:hypothetical protein